MAKIRGIKPEFWTDEAIVELSPIARLLFIGMWNFACDNGHLADKPRQIKMRVLPADDGVDVDDLLNELVENGRIERANGTVTINRFTHHQKPHKRWFTTCDLPECEHPDAGSQPLNNGGPTVEQPLGNGGTTEHHGGPTADGDGECDGESDGEPKASRRSPERPLPETWQPSDSHRAYAIQHQLDLDREVFKFRNHAAANDRRQRNWNAAFNQWLAKAAEFAAANQPQKPKVVRDQWLLR